MDAWAGSSVWAGVETSGEIFVVTGLCVMDEEETVLFVAAVVVNTVATDTVVDTWAAVVFVVATAVGFSGDDDVVTVCDVTDAAAVGVVTLGGTFTVFCVVVVSVVVCSSEGAVVTAVVTWASSIGGDFETVTVFTSAVVVMLADVVAGEGTQIGVGATGSFAEDVPAFVVPCVTI